MKNMIFTALLFLFGMSSAVGAPLGSGVVCEWIDYSTDDQTVTLLVSNNSGVDVKLNFNNIVSEEGVADISKSLDVSLEAKSFLSSILLGKNLLYNAGLYTLAGILVMESSVVKNDKPTMRLLLSCIAGSLIGALIKTKCEFSSFLQKVYLAKFKADALVDKVAVVKPRQTLRILVPVCGGIDDSHLPSWKMYSTPVCKKSWIGNEYVEPAFTIVFQSDSN